MNKELYLHDFIDINHTIYKIEELQKEAIDALEILELNETLNHINNITDLYNQIRRFQPHLNELFPHYKKAFKSLDQMTWTLKVYKTQKTI